MAMKKQVGLLLFVVIVAGLLAFFAGGDVVQAHSAPVLPPNSTAFGKTYEEWAATWWQWAYSLPDDGTHPLTVDGEMDCSLGQKGKVWFLGGNLYGSEADRICEVPVGKAIFFPIVNIVCSEWTGDDDPLACAESPGVPPGSEFIMNPLSLKIDGKKVGGLHRFLVVSQETFVIGPTPDPAIWGAPAGETTLGATRGYYVLLAPLSRGMHDIEFAGEILVTDPEDPNNPPIYYYAPEISYVLHVGKTR
jgi:hypothetical protein